MATKGDGFKIDVSGIQITPKEKEAEILADYQTAYRGQKGDAESDRDFFERKVAENILAVHEGQQVQKAEGAAGQAVRDSLATNADIPKRKDNPKVEEV